MVGSPTKVGAQTVVFSDDFSEDLEKWQPVQDSGQYWKIHAGRLEVEIPAASTITELIPKDHYWDSQWQAFQFEFDFTPLAGVDVNFLFGFQDKCNWYETHFAAGIVDLVRLLDCSIVFGTRNHFNLPQNHTYHIKITFNEGRILTYVDDHLLFDEMDWSFNQNYGRIGLKAGTGDVFPTHVAFDNVKVSLLDTGLGVPLLKQSDPRWSGIEYNSASIWSANPTIDRWGCALVSMTMILQYHGITKFTDGLPITPLSLNDWLKSQPDGYIGNGVLNWLAVTRLTNELSQVFQTPKLEYLPIMTDVFGATIQEITDQKPAILQIDGHFLVADGVNHASTDLLIKDPAYNYTYFSQHQKDLLSIRTFQPSQTDLSYLMLTYAPELNVRLEQNNRPEDLSTIQLEEKIKSFNNTLSEATRLKQVLIPKPESGQYQLFISQERLGPFSIDLYIYDQQGNPTKLVIEGIVGQKPKEYWLSYISGAPASVSTQLDWSQYRQDLYLVQQLGGFWAWPIFWLLEWTAYQAENSHAAYQPEVFKVMALQLSSYRPWMTATGYRYLTQQLNTLGDL